MYNRMLVLLLVALLLSAFAWGQTDPNERDTLYIGTVDVDAGQKAVIEVNFFNDEELGAITIPLKWSSPDITVDSISYVGGRLDYIGTKPDTVYADEQILVCGAIIIMEAFIPTGNGLAVTVYFDVPSGTPDQYITIDTVTRGPASVFFTNTDASNFFPEVVAGYIRVGDPVVQPHIELSPMSMTFDGTVGYPSPPLQQLTITNSGGGSLDWDATVSSSWLSSIPLSGTAISFVGIKAMTDGLAEGVYYDTVVITCEEADNSPQLLPVTLTMIKLPPHITTDPIVFSVSAVQGGANPADRFLTISTDVPGSELSWSVSNIESWLSLAPVSGTPPDEVTLSFDITGLSYGYYYDTVTVTDPNATNSPRKVPVTLQIVSDLPVMELEPEILHIVAKVGENPAGRSVYLSNSGEGSMTFEVQENSDIISNVMPLNGTAPANIIFSFETDTLAFGDYYDTVVIVSPEAVNSPRELIIHYHIAFNPPDLYIIPFSTSINYFECWQGMNNTPPKKYFQIENHGGGNLVWYAKYDSDWLELEYDSASNELLNSITLTENVNLLPVGVYTDTITVYSDVAMNSPKKISVTLNVIPGNQTPEIYNDLTAIDIPIQEVFGFLLGELAALGDVINVNAGCMDYWIEEDVPWLTIIDSVGEAPAYITAIVDVGSYTYGSYPDSILIYSSTASNSPQVIHLNLQVWRLLGDHDWNNEINLGDVVQMINYIFKYGPEAQPEPLVANTNCDFFVDLSDVIVLINYIFKGGNKPCGNL